MNGYLFWALACWFTATVIVVFGVGYVMGQCAATRERLDALAPRGGAR